MHQCMYLYVSTWVRQLGHNENLPLTNQCQSTRNDGEYEIMRGCLTTLKSDNPLGSWTDKLCHGLKVPEIKKTEKGNWMWKHDWGHSTEQQPWIDFTLGTVLKWAE